MKYLRAALVVAAIGLGSGLLAGLAGNVIPSSTHTVPDTLDAYLCFHASAAADTMLIVLPSRRNTVCGGNE